MKYSRSLLLFGVAATLLGQTPPPSAPTPPGPAVKLEVENPGVKPPDVPPDRVIITVGDVKITAAQFDKMVDSLQPQLRPIARGQGRKQFADNIARMLTLAQEAQRRKLTESDEYKARLMLQNANLMASVLADQLSKEVQVSDAQLREYFDAHKTEFEQVHARHILIRFQGSPVEIRPGNKDLSDAEALAKAQDIRAKLVAGGDFAALAKQESDDAGSGANGGELGSFPRGRMVPSFEEAAFALKAGEISQPVKSQFGYHIIQVLDRKGYDEVKTDVEARVKPEQTQQAVSKAIDDLQKAHPPVLDPLFFGPDKPPAPVPPPVPDKK